MQRSALPGNRPRTAIFAVFGVSGADFSLFWGFPWESAENLVEKSLGFGSRTARLGVSAANLVENFPPLGQARHALG